MLIFPEYYLNKIINVDELGAGGYAFKREDALKLIYEKFLNDFHISGGDVLEITSNNEIKFTYDSWYTNSKKFENIKDYINRSKKDTEKYIKNYNEGNRKIIYLLVIDNGPLRGWN